MKLYRVRKIISGHGTTYNVQHDLLGIEGKIPHWYTLGHYDTLDEARERIYRDKKSKVISSEIVHSE